MSKPVEGVWERELRGVNGRRGALRATLFQVIISDPKPTTTTVKFHKALTSYEVFHNETGGYCCTGLCCSLFWRRNTTRHTIIKQQFVSRGRLTHHPDDGGRKNLRNVGKLRPDYKA
jgi:hypothetical protein